MYTSKSNQPETPKRFVSPRNKKAIQLLPTEESVNAYLFVFQNFFRYLRRCAARGDGDQDLQSPIWRCAVMVVRVRRQRAGGYHRASAVE